MTKISVITVCRNDLSGLQRTFASVASQQGAEFEWLVIDGGSCDGTAKWLEEHHRLAGCWISEPDAGIYDAMNKGIGLAGGDYLLFLNSGDCFAEPDVLSKLVHSIEQEKPAPDFVYGDALDLVAGGTHNYRRSRELSNIRVGMITRHQAMLYRRELIASERYPTRFRLSADYALTASILMKEGVHTLRVPFPICRFAPGGAHDAQRLKALHEDFRIRKEILQESYLGCSLWFGVHWLHHHLRRLLPNLNTRVIYKSP